MTQPIYINLLTDYGFKKIFRTEKNKKFLINFLNNLLKREQNPIIDLTYENLE